MSDATQTPIYSLHSAEPLDPQIVMREARPQEHHESYSLLPWALEMLPGSTWRNISTGLPMRIDHIDTDNEGRHIPIAEAENTSNENEDVYVIPLGHWQDDRFCIGHWVRVDHLPPSTQLAWFEVEIAHHRKWLMKEHFTPISERQAQNNIAVAVKQARLFANQYGLTLPTDLLPVRTFPKHIPIKKEVPEKSDTQLVSTHLWQFTFESLLTLFVTAPGKFVLDIPCPSVDNLSLQEEGAVEYLSALLAGETIADFCETISFYEGREHIYFIFRPLDREELVKKLLWFAPIFKEIANSEDMDEEDGDMDEEVEEEVEMLESLSILTDFSSSLEKRVLRFPILGDMYLAHGLPSESNWLTEDPDLEKREHPEWKYGFWRSCISNNLGFDVYRSFSVWILPIRTDLQPLLVNYAGFEEGVPDLHEAVSLIVGNFLPFIFHSTCAVYYPFDDITKAQQCVDSIEERYRMNFKRVEDVSLNKGITNIHLSENGDLLVVTDILAQYIFFEDSLPRVSLKDIRPITKDLAALFSLVGEN